jgi:hypothetical protein
MVHLNAGRCATSAACTATSGGTDQRCSRAYVERLLDDAGASSATTGRARHDLISGGRRYPELPRLIRAARDRGFARVFICTNGVRLARPGYLDELIAAGLTGVRLSFHDHRAESANRLADVPGLDATYPEVAAMLLARPEVETHFFRIILADTIEPAD